MKTLLYVAGAIVAAHGLVHLLGFVAYWPLAELKDLPYKTTLMDGRWSVGAAGMRFYASLWLVATIGFVIAVVGAYARQLWWSPAMIGSIVLSTALIALDWAPSFRGAVVNGAIVVLMAVVYFLRGGLTLH